MTKEEVLSWIKENEFFIDVDEARGVFVIDSSDLADFVSTFK